MAQKKAKRSKKPKATGTSSENRTPKSGVVVLGADGQPGLDLDDGGFLAFADIVKSARERTAPEILTLSITISNAPSPPVDPSVVDYLAWFLKRYAAVRMSGDVTCC